jgi:hypothetical protein
MSKKITRKYSTLSTYLKNEKNDFLKTFNGGVPKNQSIPNNNEIIVKSKIK